MIKLSLCSLCGCNIDDDMVISYCTCSSKFIETWWPSTSIFRCELFIIRYWWFLRSPKLVLSLPPSSDAAIHCLSFDVAHFLNIMQFLWSWPSSFNLKISPKNVIQQPFRWFRLFCLFFWEQTGGQTDGVQCVIWWTSCIITLNHSTLRATVIR